MKVNTGKQYNYNCKRTNLIKVKETRRVKDPCNCIKKCFTNLAEDSRQVIHEKFWAMVDINLQTLFIAEHTKRF